MCVCVCLTCLLFNALKFAFGCSIEALTIEGSQSSAQLCLFLPCFVRFVQAFQVRQKARKYLLILFWADTPSNRTKRRTLLKAAWLLIASIYHWYMYLCKKLRLLLLLPVINQKVRKIKMSFVVWTSAFVSAFLQHL